jgi:hypothetical protein
MNRVKVHLLATACLLACGLATSARADEECMTARCQNSVAIADMRAAIVAQCDCAAASNAVNYMRCVKRVINEGIAAGTFPSVCKSAVKSCEGALGCGRGIRPLRSVQQIFTQSCALPSCHSTLTRQGELTLDSEDVSFASLVNQPVALPEAAGEVRVIPGNPKDSFLIKKLKGTAPGLRMPDAAEPLSKGTIKLIEKWIKRGAKPTAEECPPADSPKAKKGRKACNDRPLRAGTFTWTPEPALEVPAPGTGFQMYTPPKPVVPGTEWETCYAFKGIDWLGMAQQLGYPPGTLPAIKSQTYRMHQGSHHLLLYAYFGRHPEDWAEGYFPCDAGNCTSTNPQDCPVECKPSDPDYEECRTRPSLTQIPIGGTQVAGTRYEVQYPEGVGIPVFSPTQVLIANLHYTNPFQPAQDIYGESWLNIYLHGHRDFKVLLDGIFAINFQDLFVEPYDTNTISRVWQPDPLIGNAAVDAAVFQLFGHMHKRGTEFKIDIVRDGHCSGNTSWPCGRDDDCRCWRGRAERGAGGNVPCVADQTCVRGPNFEDSTIYYTTSWDHAPVLDFAKPYLLVDADQGLRWTCTHTNGIEGDPNYPPKKCHEGCESCGWDAATRTCIFRRGVGQPNHPTARTYAEGEPMPMVFGELADDDMCNMFGYFITQQSACLLDGRTDCGP